MAKIKKEQILGTNFSYSDHRLSYWLESMKRLDVTRVMHSWDLEHSARRARWHGSRVTTYGGLWTTA